MKQTIEERILKQKAHTPPSVLYGPLFLVTKLQNKMINTHFIYKAYPAKEPGPIVIVANHASRLDYKYTAPACYPKKLNYVVGYNEFFRFPTNLLLPAMQVIPKKNFVSDAHTIWEIFRVIKEGGNICFMPEGMNSITGMAQPVIPGTGKLLKKLGVPVYYSKIAGAYLTYTKHCLDERKGRIEVTVDRMFTAQELAELTPGQIEDRMNRLLAHDDYIWNREKQIRYRGKGRMAKNLDHLLYLCPKCGARYRMQTSGNEMRCLECGNAVSLDECYNLRPIGDSVCPELVTDWTIMERERAAEEVRRPDFCHEGHVRVGILPERKPLFGDKTSIVCGEGTLRLDAAGLHFNGTLKNEPYSFDLASAEVLSYGMCTDISRFYQFYKGRFLEFYPDAGDTLYWHQLTEELHRAQGGKWQNTAYRHADP